MKYRKKPVVIEARQWFGEEDEDVKPYYEGMYAAVYQPCKYCASRIFLN
jgi:hypothetical protein